MEIQGDLAITGDIHHPLFGQIVARMERLEADLADERWARQQLEADLSEERSARQLLEHETKQGPSMQSIPTHGVRDWEHFEINGVHHVTVANAGNDVTPHVDSTIYRWRLRWTF